MVTRRNNEERSLACYREVHNDCCGRVAVELAPDIKIPREETEEIELPMPYPLTKDFLANRSGDSPVPQNGAAVGAGSTLRASAPRPLPQKQIVLCQ